MDAEEPLDLLPPQEVRDHVSEIPDSMTATGHLQDKIRPFHNDWKDFIYYAVLYTMLNFW